MAGKIRDVSAYILTGDVGPAPVIRTLSLRNITGYIATSPPVVRTLSMRAIIGYAAIENIIRTLSVRKITAYVAQTAIERTLSLRKVTGYVAAGPAIVRTLGVRKITGYAATAGVERTLSVRKLTGYVAVVAVERTLKLRKITGYAATAIASSASVREINGLALVKPVFYPPFHQPSLKGLLDTINHQHGTRFVEGDLQFGPPSVLSQDFYFNSKLTVVASDFSGFSGEILFRYNRAAISKAFFRKDMTALKTFGSSVVASLPAINAKYALNLQASDVVDGPVTAGATTLKLTMAATSYYYLPGSTVTLGA